MARTTNAVKHTHQYYRLNGIWHCSGIDGCTHYMPRNMPPPVGRNSKCWGCMKEFLLTPVNMVEDKPKCDKCSEEAEILERYLEQNPLPIPTKPIFNPLAEIKRRAAENARKRMEMEEKDEIEVIEPNEE